MKAQISDDEIEVTKEPYTKEEVVAKKKPNAETRIEGNRQTSEEE
jgi:hypothetical protein